MNIFFNNPDLQDIIDGKDIPKKYKNLPKDVIQKFKRVFCILVSVRRIEDLYRYNNLCYERLKNNLKEYESVRIDRTYRLLFKSGAKPNEIIITEIYIEEITKHYEKI